MVLTPGILRGVFTFKSISEATLFFSEIFGTSVLMLSLDNNKLLNLNGSVISDNFNSLNMTNWRLDEGLPSGSIISLSWSSQGLKIQTNSAYGYINNTQIKFKPKCISFMYISSNLNVTINTSNLLPIFSSSSFYNYGANRDIEFDQMYYQMIPSGSLVKSGFMANNYYAVNHPCSQTVLPYLANNMLFRKYSVGSYPFTWRRSPLLTTGTTLNPSWVSIIFTPSPDLYGLVANDAAEYFGSWSGVNGVFYPSSLVGKKLFNI